MTISLGVSGWTLKCLGTTKLFAGVLLTEDAKHCAEQWIANELILMSREIDRGIPSEGDSRFDRIQRKTLDDR
jgi:hypothetical protein